MDTRLETFLTLCKQMNYRKTAEELHMTQPAVTQHIHYLEKQYGCKLFLYDRKTLTMTEEAKVLMKYAENVRYQETRLMAGLHRKKGRYLSVGATKTIGEFVIAEQVERYLETPTNHISICVDNTEHLLNALSRGEIDFALVEGFFNREQYASRLYRREPFVGICGRNHPFADKEISPDRLWGENILLREQGSGTRDILEQLLLEHNRSVSEFQRLTTINNFGLLLRLLEKGGISFAYRAVINNRPGLTEFKVKGWDIVREFNYVYLDTPFSEQAVGYFDSLR